MVYAVVVCLTFLAGLVQGVTGFGSAIVVMLGLPYFFTLPQSAGIASAVSVILCFSMAVRYWKHVRVKKALLPSLLYLAVCSAAIRFSAVFDPAVMKRVFGVFLLALSGYFLFSGKGDGQKKLSLPVRVFCITVSAVCDGLFGIGGPLMVLYFLNATDSSYEYLGTIQLFFLVNTLYSTVFRMAQGILLPSHLPVIGIGMIGILTGLFAANRIVDRLNVQALRKWIYGMIGISGLVNLF